MVLNRSLQEINVQNMNVELVAQMFKNYQSNVLFHLEGASAHSQSMRKAQRRAFLHPTDQMRIQRTDASFILLATESLKEPS